MIQIKSTYAFYLLLLFFVGSCTRNNEEKKKNESNVQLESVIKRGVDDQGDSWEERLEYIYDGNGKILRVIDPETKHPIESFEYSGRDLVSMLTHNEDGTVRARYDRPLRVSAGGDTVVLSLIERAGAGYDTLISTYVFRDSLLVSTNVYVHFFGQNNTPFTATTTYVHNNDNGLQRAEFEGLGSNGVAWTVLEQDTKRNVNLVFTKEQFVLLYEFDYNAVAPNNVTKMMEHDGDIVEFEWTYNADGWPLTCKRKGQPLVEWEWGYSE